MLPPDFMRCVDWYAATGSPSGEAAVSTTRDVFQARLDSLLRELLRRGWPESEATLLVATLGEVGNNSFDHNLGQWGDVSGCLFGGALSADPPLFWVADRGVGMLATLRRADILLTTEQQAMDAAFARVLSGRAPEKRGNGLKFVRSIVNGKASRALFCCSGSAVLEFGGLLSALSEAKAALSLLRTPGVAVVIAWRPDA